MNQLRYAQFKQDYASELLRIAKGDLESARGLRKIEMGRLENICYHAEQAIEKSLKAVICFRGLPVPLTHDLGILLGEIENKAEVPEHASFTEFTQYASIRQKEQLN